MKRGQENGAQKVEEDGNGSKVSAKGNENEHGYMGLDELSWLLNVDNIEFNKSQKD